MSIRRMAILQAGLLLLTMLANATSKSTMRIKVLDSVTRASAPDNNNGVPQNCEQLTFDAYCRSTSTTPLVSTLLVQEGNQPPFRIACRIESKFSRCVPLPVGESFDAKKDRHGITVYYDDGGKLRKQLYTLVASDAKAALSSSAKVAAQPAPASHTAAPVQNSSSSAPLPAQPLPSGSVLADSTDSVQCNFTSTPSGAEITVDGKYVGNTPSEIGLNTGTHVVVFSLAGFIQWKRDLTVAAGSRLVNVTATLQKIQP